MFELVANHRRLMSLWKKFGFWQTPRSGFKSGGGDVRGGGEVVEIHRIRGRITHIGNWLVSHAVD